MKTKRDNLCTVLHKKEFHFADYLKHMLFAGVGLFLIAAILFVFVGFNSGFAFGGGYEFDVKFHTSITQEQRQEYSAIIEDALGEQEFSDYHLTQIGDSYDASILVQVKTKLDSETALEKLEVAILDVQAEIDATGEIVYLQISDAQSFDASYTAAQTWLSVLAVGFVLAVVAAYVLIRYDWQSAVAVSAANLGNVMLYLSAVVLFRIPTSELLFLGLILTQILTSAYAIFQFAYIKEGFAKDELTKMPNKQVANIGVKQTLKTNILLAAFLTVVGAAFMGIGASASIEIGFALLFAGILSGFASVCVILWVWSLLFNREQDKRYLARLAKRENPKEKEEDKIVI